MKDRVSSVVQRSSRALLKCASLTVANRALGEPKMHLMRWVFLTIVALAVQAVAQHVPPRGEKPASLPKIQLNTNHQPAGYLHDHVLAFSLIADTGMWYPAGESEPGIPIQAFRSSSGPLQIPGPFIRVLAGTQIRASVKNAIPGTSLTIHGLSSHPA